MSADADFHLTPAQLLAKADTYTACDTFRIVRDGSRHHCADCHQPEGAHVLVALRQALQALAQARDARPHHVEARTWREAVDLIDACVVDHFGLHERAIQSFRLQATTRMERATTAAEATDGR